MRFIIIGAERTGTNLVRDLLASHPQVFVGGEVFNPTLIERGEIPWRLDLSRHLSELNELRRSQPPAFIKRLLEITAEHRRAAIGFKLLYGHGDEEPRALDYLVSDKSIRVIHVKRLNLLRRLLSDERAKRTGIWWVISSEPAPAPLRIRLDPERCRSDFSHILAKQAEYDEHFRDHDVLEIRYEDVSEAPETARARAIEFLGLPPGGDVRIWSRKTGTDSLRDAIANYDELKADLLQWAAFFDD